MKAFLLAVVRVTLGALFLYAASTKVPDMAKFAEETANYRMLPALLVPWFSSLMVGAEIVAGTALVLGLWSRAAAAIVGLMLVAFIVGLSQALLRGINLSCGCFGGAEAASWETVIRDVVMLPGAVAVLAWGPGKLLWFRR